jgi:hypothetical protein
MSLFPFIPHASTFDDDAKLAFLFSGQMQTREALLEDECTLTRIKSIGLLMSDAFGCLDDVLNPHLHHHEAEFGRVPHSSMMQRTKFLWTPALEKSWPGELSSIKKIVVHGTEGLSIAPTIVPITTVNLVYEERVNEETDEEGTATVHRMTRSKCWNHDEGDIAKLRRLKDSGDPLTVELPSLNVSMVTLSLTVPYALTEDFQTIVQDSFERRHKIVFRIGANPYVNNRRVQNFKRLWLENVDAIRQNTLPGLLQTLEDKTGDRVLSIAASDVVTVAFQAEAPRIGDRDIITEMTAIHTITGVKDAISCPEAFGYGLDMANVNRMWVAFYATSFDTLAGSDDPFLSYLGPQLKAVIGFRALIGQLDHDFKGFGTDESIFRFFSFMCARYNKLSGFDVFPESFYIPGDHARAIAWHRAKLIGRTKYFFGRCGSAFMEGNGRASAVAYAMADILPPQHADDISEGFELLDTIKLSKCVQSVKWDVLLPVTAEPFGATTMEWMKTESAAIQQRNEAFASRSIAECIQAGMELINSSEELSVPIDVTYEWKDLTRGDKELSVYVAWSKKREDAICGFLSTEYCKPVFDMVNDVHVKCNAGLRALNKPPMDKKEALLHQSYLRGNAAGLVVTSTDVQHPLAVLIRFFSFAGMNGGPRSHRPENFFDTIQEFLTRNGRPLNEAPDNGRSKHVLNSKYYVPALHEVKSDVSQSMLLMFPSGIVGYLYGPSGIEGQILTDRQDSM